MHNRVPNSNGTYTNPVSGLCLGVAGKEQVGAGLSLQPCDAAATWTFQDSQLVSKSSGLCMALMIPGPPVPHNSTASVTVSTNTVIGNPGKGLVSFNFDVSVARGGWRCAQVC